jgi:hypothetical protein
VDSREFLVEVKTSYHFRELKPCTYRDTLLPNIVQDTAEIREITEAYQITFRITLDSIS